MTSGVGRVVDPCPALAARLGLDDTKGAGRSRERDGGRAHRTTGGCRGGLGGEDLRDRWDRRELVGDGSRGRGGGYGGDGFDGQDDREDR